MAKDPVCGREMEDKKSSQKSDYKGRTYYFCSNNCKFQFDMNPKKYEVRVIIRKRKG